VWLLKLETTQESEIVRVFESEQTFFDRHYGHDKPPECFPLIVIGTIFDTACLVDASIEILNQ